MITKDTQLSRLHIGAIVTVRISRASRTEYRDGKMELLNIDVMEMTGRLQAYGQDESSTWIALGNDTRQSPTIQYPTERTTIEVTAEYADI